MSSEWQIHAALRCGMGRIRHNNEDAFYFNGSFPALKGMDSETSEIICVPMNETLFAVCDGIGGENNGEIASYTAVSKMPELHNALRNRDFGVVIQGWVRDINRRVRECSHEGGCTLALVYIQSGIIRIAHIGDSRVYRFHEGKLTQLTMDHSKVQMLVAAGVIKPEEARTHPQKHVITRYLGMNAGSMICEAAIDRAMPAISGDRYMICSDGITDMLEDSEIEALMANAKDAEQCAINVYRAALEAGGKDNTTIIVLEVQGPEGNGTLYFAEDDEEDEEPTVDEENKPANSDFSQNINMNISASMQAGRCVYPSNLSITINVSNG